MNRSHVIILAAVVASVIGTFFVANTVTGFSVGFNAITGHAVGSPLNGVQAATGSVLFGLLSLAALVIVARIGANSITEKDEDSGPDIKVSIEKAERAIQQGNHAAAYPIYNSLKQQYSGLESIEKLNYYARIIEIHRQLSRQATIAEANRLTDKYVNGNITEQEFEKLRELVTNQ